MESGTFFKAYGAEERHDLLMRIDKAGRQWLLVWGYGTETADDGTETGYDWRRYYGGGRPSDAEIRADITELENSLTDERILSGFEWNGTAVWLSSENQFNYKAAYDLAVQTSGAVLPVTFKLGTDEEPVYHEFTTVDELADFYTKAIAHVQQCLSDGWAEKDKAGGITVKE